jgi:hypothetical protein
MNEKINLDMMMNNNVAEHAASALAEKISEQVNRLVQFHERQIEPGINEEDVEMRERQIIRLQHEFSEVRSMLSPLTGQVI